MPFFQISKLAIKSAIKKAATRLYPFQIRPDIAKTRGRIEMHIENCTFCTLCARKCPTGAIEIDRKSIPRVFTLDRFKCVLCSACVDACMTKNSITVESHYAPPVENHKVNAWVQTTNIDKHYTPPPSNGLVTWTQLTPPPKPVPPVNPNRPVA